MGDIADWLIDSAMDQGEFFHEDAERWREDQPVYYFHSNRYAPVYRERERATDADFEPLATVTPCQRTRADGKPCGLIAPCPDCGKTLLYWPAE